MRVDTLPSPGRLSQGIVLRTVMSKAISAVEINAGQSGGTSILATQLDAFLVACRSAIAAFVNTVAPTRVSQTINLSRPRRITIRTSAELDKGFVPPTTAFAIQTGTIIRVELDGPDIILHLQGDLTSTVNTVAYTQPGAATNVRGLNAIALASFAAQATSAGTY